MTVRLTRRAAIASAGAVALAGLFPAEALARTKRHRPRWTEHPNVSVAEALRIARELARRPSSEELTLLLQHDECIDDRNLPKVGFLNYPGAHVGLYLGAAIYAAYFDGGMKDVCEAVESAIGGRERFRYHGNGAKDRLHGCKHCELIFDSPHKYFGMTADNARFVARRVEALPVDPDVLPGEHSAHIGFIVERDGSVASDGSDAWAFDTVTQHKGKDLHAFVFKPTLVRELRLRPLADALRARSKLITTHQTFAETLDELAYVMNNHFLTTVRAIAPDDKVQWFKVNIDKNGVRAVSPYFVSRT